MADQSNIQSLVQSLAQANPSSAVNNGNPNTIYNVAPVEWGYVPPQQDASGNWQIQKPRVYEKTDWNALITDVGGPLKAIWDKPIISPITQQPVQPIPTNPWQGVPTPQGGSTGPIGGAGGGGFGGGGGGAGGGWGGGVAPGAGAGMGSGGGGTPGAGANYGASGLWGASPALAAALGLNTNGGVGWQQALDVLSEPFIQGNLYNSQTGTFNWGNAAEGLGGMPVRAIKTLANLFAPGKWDATLNPDQVQNQLSTSLNKAMAKNANNVGEKTDAKIKKIAEEALVKLGAGQGNGGQTGPTNVFGQVRDPGNLLNTWVSPQSTAAMKAGGSGYQNDAWGETAAGFGIGAGAGGSAGAIALADAMKANKKNRF